MSKSGSNIEMLKQFIQYIQTPLGLFWVNVNNLKRRFIIKGVSGEITEISNGIDGI